MNFRYLVCVSFLYIASICCKDMNKSKLLTGMSSLSANAALNAAAAQSLARSAASSYYSSSSGGFGGFGGFTSPYASPAFIRPSSVFF